MVREYDNKSSSRRIPRLLGQGDKNHIWRIIPDSPSPGNVELYRMYDGTYQVRMFMAYGIPCPHELDEDGAVAEAKEVDLEFELNLKKEASRVRKWLIVALERALAEVQGLDYPAAIDDSHIPWDDEEMSEEEIAELEEISDDMDRGNVVSFRDIDKRRKKEDS